MRKEALKHKKKKSRSLAVLLWLIIFAFVQVLIAYVYALLGANSITEILGKRNFWLLGGVVNGLILIAYLMMYRIDAQNIALNENDLEELSAAAFKDVCTGGNPKETSKEDILEIYKKAF